VSPLSLLRAPSGAPVSDSIPYLRALWLPHRLTPGLLRANDNSRALGVSLTAVAPGRGACAIMVLA